MSGPGKAQAQRADGKTVAIVGTEVPEGLRGTASGALNTAAQLGTALGVSILLLVADASEDSGLPLAGRSLGWACAAVAAATGAIVVAGAALAEDKQRPRGARPAWRP